MDPNAAMRPVVAYVAAGAVVTVGDKSYCVQRFTGADRIQAVDLEAQEPVELKLSDITRTSSSVTKPDFNGIQKDAWDEAVRRYQAIRPLLESPNRSRRDVAAVAQREHVGISTIYRWMTKFCETGVVTSLLRQQRSDRGEVRLPDASETLIQDVLANIYLKDQKRSIKESYRELERLCRLDGVPKPHLNTFAARVRRISPEESTRKRRGRNAALGLRPLRGKFPGADYPYSVLQIDHTTVDIVLVDAVHRVPIGKPFITVAIDVYSRTVAGFYVSFDPPGSLGTGICIANAILPKESYLARLGIEGSWPCQGIPRLIHADNAKEFRGNMLKSACKEYEMDLQFRKVKKPNYGGHIERLLGTLLRRIHALPGSTFSNPVERGEYPSYDRAAMTLDEFERWLANLIVGSYHNELHSQINMTPLARYEQGILGDADQPGIGALPVVVEEERLRIDFLPYEKRTVQNYGVRVDNITYQADVLTRWIGARDPASRTKARKFVFRRDPRDVSFLWFYDPDAERYYRVPYQDVTHPAISLWELRAVLRYLAERGRKTVDEDAIFNAYNEMRRIEESSKSLTRKARRDQERRNRHEKHRAQENKKMADKQQAEPETARSTPIAPLNIQPFDEVEDLS